MFSILAKLGLDATGFQIGLKWASGIADKFASDLKGKLADAFGSAAVLAFTKTVIDAADRIGDLADQTGLTTDQIQELEAQVSKFGLQFEAVQVLIEKLRAARREAMDGKEDFLGAFSAIGIDRAKLETLTDASLLLKEIAKGIQGFTPESQSAILGQLAGIKAGPKFRGALGAIAEGAGKDRIAFSQSEIDALSKIKDSQGQFARESKVRVFRLFDFIAKAGTLPGLASSAIGALFGTESKKQTPPTGKTFVATTAFESEAVKIKRLEAQKKIEEEIFAIEFKRLSIEDQRAELQKDISGLAAIEKDQREAGFSADADALKLMRLRAEERLAELSSISSKSIQGNVTDLQKIGAQVSSSNETMTILKEQNLKLSKIVENTGKTASNTSDSGGYN